MRIVSGERIAEGDFLWLLFENPVGLNDGNSVLCKNILCYLCEKREIFPIKSGRCSNEFLYYAKEPKYVCFAQEN